MPLTQVDQGLLGPFAQYTGFKNRLINGAFRIAQRGVGPTTTAGYSCVDRWAFNNVGSATTYSQQTATVNGIPTTVLQIAGAAGNSAVNVYQRIEAVNCYDLVGQNATVSFWAFQNSGSASTVQMQAYAPSAVDNYASQTTITTQTVALPNNVWTFVSMTFAVPANGANGLHVGIAPNSWGPWVSGNFRLAFVQLEEGSTATSFDVRPYGTELALCQRYYEVLYSDAFGQPIASSTYNPGVNFWWWQFKQEKRAQATVAKVNGTWNAGTPNIYGGISNAQFYLNASTFYLTLATGQIALSASAEL